jgi:hypothetical protein
MRATLWLNPDHTFSWSAAGLHIGDIMPAIGVWRQSGSELLLRALRALPARWDVEHDPWEWFQSPRDVDFVRPLPGRLTRDRVRLTFRGGRVVVGLVRAASHAPYRPSSATPTARPRRVGATTPSCCCSQR